LITVLYQLEDCAMHLAGDSAASVSSASSIQTKYILLVRVIVTACWLKDVEEFDIHSSYKKDLQ